MGFNANILKSLEHSLFVLALVAAGTPTAHAAVITVNFDAINALTGPVSNATLDTYLAGFGVTIGSETSTGGNVLVSAIDERQNFAGLTVVASSAHNVLSQVLRPTSTTLSQATPAGSTAVRLTSTLGRAAGDIIAIGAEIATIASILSPPPASPAPNVTLTAPLSSAHASGATVAPRGKTGSISYTLTFSTPLDSLMFTRVTLVSGPSGITYPAWTAEALDASNAIIDSTGESMIANFSNVPAATFTLDGAAPISAVRFTSDNMLTSLSSAMFDDFVLTSPAAAAPVPASIWLFSLGLAGLGFNARRNGMRFSA